MSFLGFNYDDYGVMTPGRTAYLQYDIPETVLISPPFARTRFGGQVATPSINKKNSRTAVNVWFYHPLQCWVLKPVQTDISKFNEYEKWQYLTLRLPSWNHKPYESAANNQGGQAGLDEEAVSRNSDRLQGMPEGGVIPENSTDTNGMFIQYPGQRPVSSDFFIVKKVPAGKSWESFVSLPEGRKLPSYLPMDTLAVSNETFPANQGFFLRFSLSGNVQKNPDAVLRFLFGQFVITFDGDGIAWLCEHNPNEEAPHAWNVVHEFRYAQPGKITNTAHTLAIWPAYDAEGRRYIAFTNSALDAAKEAIGLSTGFYETLPTNQNVYLLDSPGKDKKFGQDLYPSVVTRPDTVALDVRRDIRVKWQVSLLGFPTEGSLEDLPHDSLWNTSAYAPLQGRMFSYIPEGTNLVGEFWDAETQEPWNEQTGVKPYVVFRFSSSDAKSTPFLYGYQLYKNPVVQEVDFGAITETEYRNIQLTGYDGDAQGEIGQVDITDIYGTHSRLRNRGEFYAQVGTTFLAPDGTPQNTILAQGYIVRPSSRQEGKSGWVNDRNGYPNFDWREHFLPIQGCWKRLYERVETTVFRLYAQDESAPDDPITKVKPPWKVTDAIRDLLYSAGYPPDEVLIPDLPFRLWPGKGARAPEEIVIKPEQGYAELIQRLAKNYLGAYLYREPNIAPRGAWTLLFAPLPGAAPVYEFLSTPPAGMPHHLTMGYPPNTGPVLSKPNYKQISPDFNLVLVVCPINYDGKNKIGYVDWLHNPYSCNIPGFTQMADPEHPDFFGGRVRPVVVVDPSLAGVPIGNYSAGEMTQLAVTWLTNRLYDFLCHAQQLVSFKTPANFIFDGDIQAYRPLRFQDPVLWDGVSYLVKQPDINIVHSHNQVYDIELIKVFGVI